MNVTALDPVFDASSALLFALDGRVCTVRRPHTVERADKGAVAGNVEVKTTAAAGADSVVLHVNDGGEKAAKGLIPGGTALTINAVEYTAQADAAWARTADTWTVSISPVLAAEAAAGTAVTLPEAASFGTAADPFRYLEDVEGVNAPTAFEVGTRIWQIRLPSTLPTGFVEFRAGKRGDYLADEDGNNVGRVVRVLDKAPDAVTVVVE